MGDYRCFWICLIVFAFYANGRCQATAADPCRSVQDIPCDNSECVARDRWCDGFADCGDGSDEKYCLKKSGWFGSVPDNHCTEKHFTCDKGVCIPAVARCDDFDDCGDFSDEDNCEELTTQSTGQSIPLPPEEDGFIPEISSENRTDSFGTDDFDSYSRFLTRSTTSSRSTTTSTARYTPSTTSFDAQPAARFTTAAPLNSFTPTVSTTTDFYAKKNQESIDANQRGHFPTYLPPNYYGQHQNGQFNNRNQWNQQPYHFDGGSRTTPRQHFSTNDYSSTTRYPARTNVITSPPSSVRGDNDLHRTVRNSYVHRKRPMEIRPRTVLYPPSSRQLHYTSNKTRSLELPPFYFSHNYTEEVGYSYERNVKEAKDWLIGRRDSSYGWGEDTPRPLVALSLITNSFTSNITDNELMKKGLQTHLGIKLLRDKIRPMAVTRLALYINALLATCQNPRDFLGRDLVDMLYVRRNDLRTVTPLVYLTLCLSNTSLPWQDIEGLKSLLVRGFSDDVRKDRHILAIIALSCFVKQLNHYGMMPERDYLGQSVHDAAHYLLSQKMEDESFGNIYSTAIAVQALMSVSSISWNPRPTLDFLARKQFEDGSFGDMLSTYYIIPALSGRSLLHLRNTQCDRTHVSNGTSPEDILNRPGPKKSVFYSLAIGYPERLSISMQLTVPEDTNFFDIMRVAEYLDPRYKFNSKISDGEMEVDTISGVPNDPERVLYWNLYILDHSVKTVDLHQRYLGDIQRLIPQDSEELLFWYLQSY